MNAMAKKYVVAVDLGGTKLAGALVDSKGRVSKEMTSALWTRVLRWRR